MSNLIFTSISRIEDEIHKNRKIRIFFNAWTITYTHLHLIHEQNALHVFDT